MRQPGPVAITGLGCICAPGRDLDSTLAALFRGTRAPGPPQRFSTTHGTRYPVFEVEDFPEVPGLLRTSALALHAVREALADADLDPAALGALRVGVCMGTTVGSTLSDEGFCRDFRAGCNPDLAPLDRVLASNPAAVIAREYNLSGPCQTVVNACSSGTDAVGLGASWIRAGLCDVVITGGADELGRITYNGFAALRITDEAPCRPFDRSRQGLNLGEGAGILILQSEATRRRRARAWVLGYGSACDAYHQTAPRPDGAGLKRALAEALAMNATPAEAVAFVNAHGTGTPDNDRVETRVLGECLPGVPFHSTKGYTGHTLGAAGAIEAAFTAAFLERRELPASAGFQDPDPDSGGGPVRVNTAFAGTVALSQSLAFGGNNAVLVLGRGERP